MAGSVSVRRRRSRRLLTVFVALLTGLLAVPGAAVAGPEGGPHTSATGTPLRPGTGLYPRLLRLEHSGDANGQLVAGVLDFDAAGAVGAIYRSTDNGKSFAQVGAVHDPATTAGACCSTLLELPQQVGAMPAGTLLWAASAGNGAQDRRMWVPIWKSADHGTTWSYLSTCHTSPNTGGIWEPELSVTAKGELACHYGDESDKAAHDQATWEVFSADGITWGTPYPVVTPAARNLRPGMPTIRRLGDGTFLMSYEICATGNQYDCAGHFRTSVDGADWGPPTDEGPLLASTTGQYYTHAMTLSLLSDGRPIVAGQQLREANGEMSAGSGHTALVRNGNAWTAIPAPVTVPNPGNEPCANYSPSLASSADGRTLIEVSTDHNGNACTPYFASAALG